MALFRGRSILVLFLLLGLVGFALINLPTVENEVPENSAEMPTTLVISRLDNPSGVAVHPDNGHVFIASHQGVFRYVPTTNEIYSEINGFGTDKIDKKPKYKIGPLGCTVWEPDRLIVPDGSQRDGEEVIRIYKISDEPPANPRNAKETEFELGPIKGESRGKNKGEGNYYAAVIWDDSIYVTSNGDDTKGWIVASKIVDGKPGELTLAIATKEATHVNAPVAITTTPDGNSLVVGQMGEVFVPGDSLLTFYDKKRQLTKKLKTGLNDITGLAYSPKTARLYATDFAFANAIKRDGGLFELVVDKDEVLTRKILSLDRPTSLCFDKNGALYITVFGAGKGTGREPNGGLIRIESGL